MRFNIIFLLILILLLIQPAYAGTSATANDTLTKTYQMLAVCENSRTTPYWNYAENINDHRGITFGAVGFTTGTYDGNVLIKYYTTLNPNNTLAKYIPALDAIDAGPHPYNDGTSDSVVGLDNFITDVNANNDPLWRTAQLYEIQHMYWNPTVAAWNTIGAKNELTLAFLYNIDIRFGEDGLQSCIDGATTACGGTPAIGIDENTYLRALIAQMDAKIAQEDFGDTDRNNGFKTLLNQGNVNLTVPFTFTLYGDSYTITGNLDLPTSTSSSDSFLPVTSTSTSTSATSTNPSSIVSTVSTLPRTSTSTSTQNSVAPKVFTIIPTAMTPIINTSQSSGVQSSAEFDSAQLYAKYFG